MSHDVFISHSSRDKLVGDATCAALEARGHRCWIAPRDIVPGQEWGEAIIDGIRGARVFVLIFSGNANESHQVRREVERASSLGLPVIPFRIEDVAPSKTLEYFMSSPHWLDALTPPLRKHLDYLGDVIGQILSGAPAQPPTPQRDRPRAARNAGAAAPAWRPTAGTIGAAAFALAFAALPISMALIGIAPPWPPAIAWVSAAIVLVAMLVGRALDVGLTPRRRRMLMLAATGAAVAGLFLYLVLYASFVVTIPGGERVVLGYRCNEMGQALHPDSCPYLDARILQTAEWDPGNLFTAGSILTVRMALVAAWLMLLLGLAGAAGWALAARGETE
jgi:hypothetical protein